MAFSGAYRVVQQPPAMGEDRLDEWRDESDTSAYSHLFWKRLTLRSTRSSGKANAVPILLGMCSGAFLSFRRTPELGRSAATVVALEAHAAHSSPG
eukprot:3393184-Prymnesium_polylepis.2